MKERENPVFFFSIEKFFSGRKHTRKYKTLKIGAFSCVTERFRRGIDRQQDTEYANPVTSGVAESWQNFFRIL